MPEANNKTLQDENWFGTGQRIVMAFDEFDALGRAAAPIEPNRQVFR